MPVLLLLLALVALPLDPPADVAVRPGEGRVIVRWSAVTGATGYRVYRSADGGATFGQITPAAIRPTFWIDTTVVNGTTYRYDVRSYASGQESAPGAGIAATPDVQTDDEFLDLVSHTAFDFLWNEANPANGLVKDRSTPGSAASIASVGFALTAYGVAVEKGWITREAARTRTLNTLRFFWNAEQSTDADATGYKGFFYHFLDMQTGQRRGTTELSTIDTALLLGGVLYAREFYGEADDDENEIRALADSINRRVDWSWASPRAPRVALGWKPESGFLPYDWGGYNEAMILYLLALGSPTHPISASAWNAWTGGYSFQSYYSPGKPYVTFPPLFGHQYSHVWVDFRGIQDAFMRARGLDYFENSRRATLAQRAYTTANPSGFVGYDANGWGITASDYPGGYRARGALPVQNDDGTLVPTGPGGSYAFTPDESLASLRAFYDRYPQLWGQYGFKDAVNPTKDWVATDFLGIDQGPITLMIENGRSEAVWKWTMRAPEIQAGLARAGFEKTPVAVKTPTDIATTLTAWPNPARETVRVAYTVSGPSRLTLFDALGREVWTSTVQAASGTLSVSLAGRAAGVYVLRLESDADVQTRAVLHL